MRAERQLMRGAGPSAVLQVLSTGEKHGYELAEALIGRDDGVLATGQGALYPLLYNLEAKGWLSSRTVDSVAGPRRYYRLTDSGRARLASQELHWAPSDGTMAGLEPVPGGERVDAGSLPDAAAQPDHRKRSAIQIIIDAQLPWPIYGLLTGLVRRARLWRREAARVAMELVAHFRDGLDAGRTAEELVADFGAPAVTARLVRRSLRRQRPLWWWFLHRLQQAAGILFFVYIGLALLLATRKPNIGVDYLAKLNERAASATPEQSAWPIYRKAFIGTGFGSDGDSDPMLEPEGMWVEYGDDSHRIRLPWPEDPQWTVFEPFAGRSAPIVEAARQAADKPRFGLMAHVWRDEFSAEDRLALYGTAELPAGSTRPPVGDDTDPLRDAIMMAQLPHLNMIRGVANALSYDIQLAAVQGDGDRIVADVKAILAAAWFAGEQQTLSSQFVRIGLNAQGSDSVVRVLDRGVPLTRPQLVELTRTLSADRSYEHIDFTAQRWVFEDVLQRLYSDDGRGDGRLTLAALPAIVGLAGDDTRQDTSALTKAGRVFSLPAVALAGGSRKRITDDLHRYCGVLASEADMPLWDRLAGKASAERLAEELRERPRTNPWQVFLSAVLPSLDRAAQTSQLAKAERDAVLTLLALHVWKLDHGAFPDSLGVLVPQYLPAIPLDHSTGGPLRYKLRDGKPLLYGLGTDGDDDGGIAESIPITERRSRVPHVGDWVLYPDPGR
jgi:PadR family transcriptional regulator PadR